MQCFPQAGVASPHSQQRCPSFNRLKFFLKLINIVLKKLPWLTSHDGRKWHTPDLLQVLVYAWLRGYSIDNASDRLNKRFFLTSGKPNIVFRDGREARFVPHQTTVNSWLKHFSLTQTEELIKCVFETQLLMARAYRPALFRQVLIDYDFTYEGYWGKRRDNYIDGSHMVKGTNHIRHYHGVLIHVAGYSLFCGLDHTPKNTSKIPFMIQTAKWLLAIGFKPRYAAMDREYYRYDILAEFKKLGIDVITPAKEYNQLKSIKKDYLEGNKGRIQRYRLGNKNKAGRTTRFHECWVILFVKPSNNLGDLRTAVRHRTMTISDASERIFALITTRAPQWRGDSFPTSIRQYYRFRWGIETGFREVDEHPTIWRSDHDGERLFCEAGGYFIYNEWQLEQLQDRRKKKLTFQMFRNEQIDEIAGEWIL